MSNETMPEKIWAEENGTWEHEHSVLRDYIPYVREDTTLSKAEVAREFMDEASSIYLRSDASSLWKAMLDLVAEWEAKDAEGV